MLFKSEELFLYIIRRPMQDKNIVKLSAKYCYDILSTLDILKTP